MEKDIPTKELAIKESKELSQNFWDLQLKFQYKFTNFFEQLQLREKEFISIKFEIDHTKSPINSFIVFSEQFTKKILSKRLIDLAKAKGDFSTKEMLENEEISVDLKHNPFDEDEFPFPYYNGLGFYFNDKGGLFYEEIQDPLFIEILHSAYLFAEDSKRIIYKLFANHLNDTIQVFANKDGVSIG